MFSKLLNSENGYIKTYEPLKVTFDYFAFLKDKYRRELESKYNDDKKHEWEDIPIKPALKSTLSGTTYIPMPEDAYLKNSFKFSNTVRKGAPRLLDDMPLPTVVKQQKIALGTYEEPVNGGLGSDGPRNLPKRF